MTHTTDQERAEFEAWATAEGLITESFGVRSEWSGLEVARKAWQAARRAQVVPKFSPVAQTKLGYLLEAGEVITGYAIENKDGRRGAIDCHGFVYWWNDAAPVQMPEPEATVHSKIGTTCMFPSSKMRKGDKIYTEHQVLQLLAAKRSAPSVDTIGVMPEPRWYSPSPGDAAHFPYYTPEDVRQLLAQQGIN